MTTEPWRLFWAKTNREKIEGLPDDWTHPLWAHLIDVGSAAQVLWDNFLTPRLKQKMADALGMNLTDAGRFLSIWIGLHDLGKGIPSFQGIPGAAPEVVYKLAEAGLHVHPEANRLHHGHASIAIVRRWLHLDIDEDRQGKPLPESLLDALATCVGIHHGKLSLRRITDGVAEDKRIVAALGDNHWKQAQLDLANAVFNAWGANWPKTGRQNVIDRRSRSGWPDWMMAFAGWATLADWLGSMQTCYDHTVRADDDLATYLESSRAGAMKAYQAAGLKHQAKLRVKSFKAHFGNRPRPLQSIARKVSLDKNTPNLLIVEAPTGEGKTEAAFYLAGRFGQGIYAAMPSQSTSDGLYPRLAAFLKGDKEKKLRGAHVGDTAALRLVHGNDLLRDDALSLLAVEDLTASIVDDDDDERTLPGDTGAKNHLLSWFMPKKRALLVPYGVGTVDQIFLGVLFAKHFFLRLFALCGKTVIFDEVHAYDTYMNTLFGRLLPWLRALDINVVVLSATLPGEARRQMITAWGAQPDLEENSALAPYPVTWQVAGGQMISHSFKPDSKRGQRLTFQWCSEEVSALAKLARKLIGEGATVLVICNKVDRAQELFSLLDDDVLLPPEDRLLLHARMPQAWRQDREEKARERFGPRRPDRPGLLVGTQVIEQSLDLDADAMITDLAPVDLLLQRAGRLHRHHRDNRPAGYETPVLYIACPKAEPGELPNVDELSAAGRIYGRKLLWQTWAVLQHRKGWALPLGDATLPGYRELVEAVYTQQFSFSQPLNPAAQVDYEKANDDWNARNGRQQADADGRLIPPPNHMQDLFQAKENLLTEDEDNPNGNVPKHLQAFTRDPEGVNAEVLLLHRTDDGWGLTPTGPTLIRRGKKQYMTPELLRSIFGAAVRISHGGIVSALWKEPNEDWQQQQEENRLLKRFQLIELTHYTAVVGGVHLELNERLGLIYNKP
ncbi:CRISPR-associated helicase/endonuclease Cas3 [Rudanella lutea]|uniref:CRISPR-associated helicase/endonuclease Cas3 n=1 Tax=Rudanella lutea TaxID=451374 RepID=UPI00037E5F77|nr:CRISPR-associated helicase/endonuclease Cas3 [Rudanella lutea]